MPFERTAHLFIGKNKCNRHGKKREGVFVVARSKYKCYFSTAMIVDTTMLSINEVLWQIMGHVKNMHFKL